MRSRDVVGKRIVKIHHVRMLSSSGPCTVVASIELEDGIRLIPVTVEPDGTRECEYGTTFAVNKTQTRKGRQQE